MSYKFDFNRRLPSSSEIEKLQDFDTVLESYESQSRGTGSFRWWILGISFIVSLLLIVSWLYNTPSTETATSTDTQVVSTEGQLPATDTFPDTLTQVKAVNEPGTLDASQVVNSEKSEQSIPIVERDHSANNESENVVQPGDTPADNAAVRQEQPAPNQEYIPARFPYGIDSLNSYITNNMIYPDTTITEGVVKVRFRVRSDSTIVALGIEEGVSEEFDWEAFRLVSEMPKWAPATANGIRVNSEVIIPIRFKRTEIKSDSSAYEN